MTRIVTLSGRGLDAAGGQFAGMATAERAVRASGVAWTILRANNFNQNFDEDLWQPALKAGRLALPTGGVPEPFLDVADIAEVAATILTAPGDEHAGRVYELSGPQALPFAEATAVMARAAGHPIRFEELTAEQYRAELAAEGYPAEAVDMLDALFAVLRDGHGAKPTDDVRNLLGREARAFATYAAEAARNGAW